MVIKKLKFMMLAIFATLILLGCTTTDPYSGQQKVDVGATAGVAGLALGVAALGVAVSNNDNDRYRGPAYRPYPRARGVGYRGGRYRGRY